MASKSVVKAKPLPKEDKASILEAAKSVADSKQKKKSSGAQEPVPVCCTSVTRNTKDADTKLAPSSSFGISPSSAERKNVKESKSELAPSAAPEPKDNAKDESDAEESEHDHAQSNGFEAMANKSRNAVQQHPFGFYGDNLIYKYLSIMQLPRLQSTKFKDIVAWEEKLRFELNFYAPGKFNATCLIAPGILKYLAYVTNNADLSDLEALVPILFDVFMPVHACEKIEVLQSVRFEPPNKKSPFGNTYAGAIIWFNWEFEHMATALHLFDEKYALAKIYIAALPVDFRKAIYKHIGCTKLALSVATDGALEVAKFFDDASFYLDYKPSMKSTYAKRFSTPCLKSHDSFSTSVSHKSYFGPTCYSCGLKGHKRNQCPALFCKP